MLSLCGVFLLSCAKDPLRVDRNRPPRTFLVAAPVDTIFGDVGYSYRIHLYWRGEDSDGYVVGFLYSWDDSSIGAFRFTSKTDSIFELTVNDSSTLAGGGGTIGNARYHTFYIRAVDNLGKPDPSLTIFNRRLFNARTEPPKVFFTGDIPNLNDMAEIDTLCDGAPFRVCWFARDPDGIVTRYKVDVGSFAGPFTADSCATFNDPSVPGSIPLPSGLYTMTVSAVDNANAVGKGAVQFVVNRDPETWFKPLGAPIGHYIQHYLNGSPVRIEGTFKEGDTVPFRSTVWWEWDGEDSHGGCESNCLSGFSLLLDGGTRDDDNPYAIGFLDTLSTNPLIRFTSNEPGRLAQAGFAHLILDSLDAGIEIHAEVKARDCSNRADGTPARFRFHCNFPPQLESLAVRDTCVIDFTKSPPDTIPSKLIEWVGKDFEDGLTEGATVTLNDTQRILLDDFEQSLVIPISTFRALSPSGTTHSVKVRVEDRAEFKSPLPEGEKVVVFEIPLGDISCTPPSLRVKVAMPSMKE